MTTEITALNATLREAVRAAYAETSPFTNQAWVVGLELTAAAGRIDISDVTAESLESVIQLAKSRQYLDGHNWSDMSRAVNQGVIDIAQLLLSRKSKKVA